MTIKYPMGGHVHVDPLKSPGDDGKEIFWPSLADMKSYSWLGEGHRKQMAHLVIIGEPVPAGRPRFTRQGHAFDPKKSRDYKRIVSLEAAKQYHGPMLEHKPLRVDIRVYRPIQTSISKLKHRRRAEGLERPIVKPDTSNYVKLIEDALTGIVWKDDNLITDLVASKWYSDEPRIEVTVTEAE